jgi:hypothetical protein
MDYREDLLLSITVKLRLLLLTPAKMQSSSPRPMTPPVLRPIEVATSLVVEPLLLTSPTPEPHLPTSGSGHHYARLLHLTTGSRCLLRVPRPAPPTRADLIPLEVHELDPVLSPPPEPNPVPPSPRLLTP